MNAPTGSLVAYATGPGKTASDGSGDNGLYTSALLRYFRIPNLKIEEVFKRVRIFVKERSGGGQIPWENTSLEGDFYFFIEDEESDISKVKINEPEGNEDDSEKSGNWFVDTRDQKKYRYVTIGDQVWMAENLNYFVENSSWCYGQSSRNCTTYGRLYTWEAAREACPEGWHLPTDEEWIELEMNLGMSQSKAYERYIRGEYEGLKLRTTGEDHWIISDSRIHNEFGFSALPAGSRDPGNTYNEIGRAASFWTATEYSAVTSWMRMISIEFGGIHRVATGRTMGNSVRCIKDN